MPNLGSLAVLALFTAVTAPAQAAKASAANANHPTLHRTIQVNGLDIFYREAGPKDAPAILLLHGFPTSSHMFRNLIPALADKYGSNPPLYPKWQEYFRQHQPPTLIVWGKNDHIFPADGAHPYRRDLRNLELHLLDTGHFALEEEGATIAARIRSFLAKQNL